MFRFLKYLVVVSATLFSLTAAAYPVPQGHVSDFANVINPPVQDRLEILATEFERQTTNEIAIATVATLEDKPVEDYAVELYKQWGIGKKGKDNGLLILVAPNERQLRIEVGYGLEPIINDALAGRIIREIMIPWFKKGVLELGIMNATTEVIKIISEKENIKFDTDAILNVGNQTDYFRHLGTDSAPVGKKFNLFKIVALIIFLIFFIPFLIRHPILALYLLSSLMSGGRTRGGFGGGFSGFGGFGGGGSGGGGASSRW